MNSLNSFNKGDFSEKIPLFGNNCAGRIIPGINDLSVGLTRLFLGIKDGSLATINVSEKLSEQSILLTSKIEQQETMLIRTAASMEQISAGTKINLESTIELDKISTLAHHSANQGDILMMKLTERMDEISLCANKMDEIIAIIDSIAFETNLLALNAAIESSRAGEYGKGFSIVSREVRNLSNQTSESSKNIKTLIEMMSDSIKNGGKLVSEVRDNMKNISAGVNEIDTLTGSLSQATNEQEKGMHQIALAISDLEKINQSNSIIGDELAKSSADLAVLVSEMENKTCQITISDSFEDE